MKLTIVGSVVDAQGAPLADAEVTLHTMQGRRVTVAGRGRVAAGRLQVAGELTPLWSLRIGGRAVLAVAQRLDGTTLELLPIAMRDRAVALPALHVPKGQLWGGPVGWAPPDAEAGPLARDTLDSASLAAALPAQEPVALSLLVGNAAQQLQLASLKTGGLQLGGSSLRLTGLASTSGETLAMKFPVAAEELAAGAAMSQLALSFNAPAESATPTAPPAAAPLVPDVTGYARELAQRKLAAQRFVAQFRSVVGREGAVPGVVLRQLPAAGQSLSAGSTVLLFIATAASN